MSTPEQLLHVNTGVESIGAEYRRLLETREGILAGEEGGELEWLGIARERAFDRWRVEGLPTRRNEEWKYTSVTPVAQSKVVMAPAVELKAARFHELAPLEVDVEAELVFVNGRFAPDLSRRANAKGIAVEVLSGIFEDCVENGWSHDRRARLAGFKAHLESSDADRETVFAAINTSTLEDAVLIHVDAGVAAAKLIVVTHITVSETTGAELPTTAPRVFASVDKRGEAVILERFLGDGAGRYMTNSVTDLRIADGGRLSYCRLQSESEAREAMHFGTIRVRQGRDSWSEVFQFSFGAGLSRQDLHVSLEGEGAETVVDGLYMVHGQQHVDNHTVIEHVVPHTTSEQVYKGVLGEQARAVFNGKIHIHQAAQKSSAAQLNNNLVLSSKAEVDTKPELEIFADDVKASHGATIGQLDPDHVFYLQTRAIPRNEAVALLARGFAMDVVYRLKSAALHAVLAAAVDAKFKVMPEALSGAAVKSSGEGKK